MEGVRDEKETEKDRKGENQKRTGRNIRMIG